MQRLYSKSCLFLITLLCLVKANVFCQTKPLYQLPLNIVEQKSVTDTDDFLVGTDSGLFRVRINGIAEPLWTVGKVNQIIKTEKKWYFSTDKGILSSEDLYTFKECNNGLPFLTIKEYKDKQKTFVKQTALLKDLSIDPFDSNTLVTATKDCVYLSVDGGENWKSIGSMSSGTGGMKAVAVSHMPVYDKDGAVTGSEVVVFMSHPIYGFSYYRAEAKKPAWVDVTGGFDVMPTQTYPDEISDIIPVVTKDSNGTLYAEIFCSQSFIPNLYRFDWKSKRGVKVYSGTEPCDTIDGLCQSNGDIVFVSPGDVKKFNLNSKDVQNLPQNFYKEWRMLLNSPHAPVNTCYIPENLSGMNTALQLSELWLLNPNVILTPWEEKANSHKSIYVSAGLLTTQSKMEKYKDIIKKNKLDSIVVDMKDDAGSLRFTPESTLVKEKCYVSSYALDLDQFINEFKKDNIYLIARIVVFKDKNLWQYSGGKYAVWDRANNKRWRGTKPSDSDDDGSKDSESKYYEEHWVDPYCEEVWEYNVEIAKELVRRGFDEIQFDYIRFPTDGLNMKNASFRWQDKGMDKESALVSFLSYARKNIDAPLGIDIYGANGWYRSGTRTGQDVELMSDYVDVICPMFYPSHFEQSFLTYKPLSERTYRIYYYGSYRNTVIGRNHIIVRPWIQAFYLKVKYDTQFYGDGKDYIRHEVYGVRDGLNRGYMFWNNSGRYDDISPDVGDSDYPWSAPEASHDYRKPAFSSKPEQTQEEFDEQIKAKEQDMISILDTVLNPEYDFDSYGVKINEYLQIEPFGNVSK